MWWKFQGLELAAAANLDRNIPLLRGAWKAFATDTERERLAAESEAIERSGVGDVDGASLRLTQFMEETAERAFERAAELSRECSQ